MPPPSQIGHQPLAVVGGATPRGLSVGEEGTNTCVNEGAARKHTCASPSSRELYCVEISLDDFMQEVNRLRSLLQKWSAAAPYGHELYEPVSFMVRLVG